MALFPASRLVGAAALVALATGCPPPQPSVVVAPPHTVSRDSVQRDSAQRRRFNERHFPVADVHGPLPRPALIDTADDPNDALAYYRLGVILMDSVQGVADRAFYWATQLDPSFAEAYFARWVLRRHRAWRRLAPNGSVRQREDASLPATDSLLVRAVSYDPFVDEPLDFSRLAPYLGTPRRPPRDQTLAGARAYLDQNYRKALDLWAKVIRKNAKALLLRVPRAYAWVKVNEPDSAIAELTVVTDRLEAFQRDSIVAPYYSKERFHYAIGFLHARRDRHLEARAAYERALTENLGFYMAHVRLAGVALAAHDTMTALNGLETATLIKPDDPFVTLYYGVLLMQMGRFADARRQYEASIAADSDYALPRFYLGQLFDRQRDTASARASYVSYLARASRSAPDREWARARLAR